MTLCVLCTLVSLAACAPGPVDTQGDGQTPLPGVPVAPTDLDPVLAPSAALPTSTLPSPDVAAMSPTVDSTMAPPQALTFVPDGIDEYESDSGLGPMPGIVTAPALGAASEAAVEPGGTAEPEIEPEPATAPAPAAGLEIVPEPAVEPEPMPESVPEPAVEPGPTPEPVVEPDGAPEPDVTPGVGPEPAAAPDPEQEAASDSETAPDSEPAAEAPGGNPFDVVDEPELGAGSDGESEAGESGPEATDPVDEEPVGEDTGDELPTHDPNGIPYCD